MCFRKSDDAVLSLTHKTVIVGVGQIDTKSTLFRWN